ncbi:DUF4097 family beta strand repeat-containing protein [Amycolatopsis silviterrae]|uniref:DUF4097 family beta strand repeat-containing protein n=1 Tax=Amycolatopsis silviterrae TaxID=1656914 RepID=A0ABW5H864_9PSEU
MSVSACQLPVAQGEGEQDSGTFAVGWPGTARDTSTLSGSATAVKIDSAAGYVRLRSGGTAGTITVEREIRYQGTKPEGTWHRLTGSTLELDGNCGNQCIVSYTVTAPDRMAATGKMGAGEFEAAKISSLDLTMSAGRLAVQDCAGPVKAVTTVGEVDITMSTPADATVKTNVGAVSLNVPGTDYAVSAKTTVGDRSGTLPDRQSGAHRIDVSSSAGEIRLDSH